MATETQSAANPRQASFRHLASGAIVNTGCFHDVTRLPGGEDVDLDHWEAGFTDDDGRFYDRREAARLMGVPAKKLRAMIKDEEVLRREEAAFATEFGPYCSSRFSASSWGSPVSCVPRLAMVAAASA
jgi:hypothetical protein